MVGGEREAGVVETLKTVWTRPLPKVVSPTMRARSWSCSAPETISAAEAVLRLTRTTMGYLSVPSFAVGCAVDLVGEGAAALGDDDLALLEELVGDIDGLVEQAAGVVAEIEDEAMQGPAAWKLSSASPNSRLVVSMKLVMWM